MHSYLWIALDQCSQYVPKLLLKPSLTWIICRLALSNKLSLGWLCSPKTDIQSLKASYGLILLKKSTTKCTEKIETEINHFLRERQASSWRLSLIDWLIDWFMQLSFYTRYIISYNNRCSFTINNILCVQIRLLIANIWTKLIRKIWSNR